MRLLWASTLLATALATGAFAGETVTVKKQTVDDRKAVIATVQTSRLLLARARIGGTVGDLKVTEGSEVKAGDRSAPSATRRKSRSTARASCASPASRPKRRSTMRTPSSMSPNAT